MDISLQEIEEIEMLTLRWVFQSVLDFGMEAHEIFLKSPDSVKDIAEDVTRELLDRLSGFNVQQRIYGTEIIRRPDTLSYLSKQSDRRYSLIQKQKKKTILPQSRCLKPPCA